MSFPKTLIKALFASLITTVTFSTQADSYTITFDEAGLHSPTAPAYHKNYGTIIDNEYGSDNLVDLGGIDVTFWAQKSWNVNKPSFDAKNADLFLTLFNSDAKFTTPDPDLIVKQGNLAIIHEEASAVKPKNPLENGGKCIAKDDRCYRPDDRASGGFVFVEFDQPVSVHSLDLIDVENNDSKIGFFDSSQNLIGGWNTMEAFGAEKVGQQDFASISAGDTVSYMVLKFSESAAFKNLSFSRASIPEPSTIALFGLAIFFAARTRKKLI